MNPSKQNLKNLRIRTKSESWMTDTVILGCDVDVQSLLHNQIHPPSGSIYHQGLLPNDWVVVVVLP